MGVAIGIFSPKGGVGKTILASNLAVAFGVGHNKKTILIDLNMGGGSADLLLDLDPDRSWSDLIPVIHELTPQLIRLTLTEFRPGLDILASPPGINLPETLTKEYLSLLLDALKEEYDLMVLDNPAGNEMYIGGALDLVDIQLLVLTPDMPSLRSISRLLAEMNGRKQVSGLIINQHSPGAVIDPTQIKDHLGQPVFGILPMDADGVWSNISYGEPCVLRKSSKLGKSIRTLSTRLLKVIEQVGIEETRGD